MNATVVRKCTYEDKPLNLQIGAGISQTNPLLNKGIKICSCITN